MAFIETALGYGVLGIPIGYVGARWLGSAAGTVLRPLAKTLIKSALVVSDGIEEIVDRTRGEADDRSNGHRRVTIAVETAAAVSPKRSGHRSRRRPPSAGGKQPKPRKVGHR